MTIALNPIELRMLGVLIEKSLTQPAYYPMTLSAITVACNQKSNRDPVINLNEGEVATALRSLQRTQLVTQADPDRGSRANRFQHEVEDRLGWNAAQRALMAELMLRGPQTVGELRGRASRMTHLASTDYTRELLEELTRTDPPTVVELPREPGRSATRWAHLLGTEQPADSAAASTTTETAQPTDVAESANSLGLETRLNALEREVIALRLDLDTLRGKVGA